MTTTRRGGKQEDGEGTGEKQQHPLRILSLDQSYTRTGVALFEGTDLLLGADIPFKGCTTRLAKRLALRAYLEHVLAQYGPLDIVTIERVRLHRQGRMNIGVAIAQATLVTCIRDTVALHPNGGDIVKSIDTRAWKSAVLGNPNATKQDAIWYVKACYSLEANDDLADAICMGVYASRQPETLDEVNEQVTTTRKTTHTPTPPKPTRKRKAA